MMPDRREFLAAAAGMAAPAPPPIIDTHVHLFDPRRPQGVPWPPKENKVLYRPALPDRLRALAAPLGVTGAIEVECSPWLEDNQWVLDVAAKDPFILGTVGDLEPGRPDFRKHLERFRRNPLFRGIRCGNLWGRNLGAELGNREFVADLKALAEAGLELDTANPTPALIAAVVRVTDLVPGLRVVVDHLPGLTLPADAAARRAYQADLRELAGRPQVYVKISQVLRRADGRVPDELWDLFGEDRLLYGSDWPNSDQWGDYARVFSLARAFIAGKGPAAAEKFFWKNAVAAYRLRTPPHLR